MLWSCCRNHVFAARLTTATTFSRQRSSSCSSTAPLLSREESSTASLLSFAMDDPKEGVALLLGCEDTAAAAESASQPPAASPAPGGPTAPRGRSLSLKLGAPLHWQPPAAQELQSLSLLQLEHLPDAAGAAEHMQRVWRGHTVRQGVRRFIEYNYARGSLDEARRHAQQQVRRQASGELFPLNSPLSVFRVFGGGVDAYMHFTYRWMHVFTLCALLALPGLLANYEGQDMREARTLLTALSLGNVDVLLRSGAIMELVVSGALVRFLFWARTKQLAEAVAAREAEVTPADFSVMISGLPETLTDAAVLRAFVQGLHPALHDTIATSLSVDCADLIRSYAARARLLTHTHELQAQLFLLRRQSREGASSASSARDSLAGGGVPPSPLQSLLSRGGGGGGGGGYRAPQDKRLRWRLEKLQERLDGARAQLAAHAAHVEARRRRPRPTRRAAASHRRRAS